MSTATPTIRSTALVFVASGIKGDEGMKELKCNTSPLLPERSEGKEGWMRSRRGGLFQHHRATLSVQGGLLDEKKQSFNTTLKKNPSNHLIDIIFNLIIAESNDFDSF